MRTQRLSTTEHDLSRAAELLRLGDTVAFPTESVYGLGANALDSAAVACIFEAKQRPAWDPLIVHLAEVAQLPQVAVVPAELYARVERLTRAFWPGPLTLLLPKTAAVPASVTAGRELVGVRLPLHPVARRLIALAGVPLAAPSANRFGHTSPTTAQHVLDDLDGRIAAVIDGGVCTIGLESTVLDPATMTLYRPGAVSASRLEAATGAAVTVYHPPETAHAPQSLPSPGVGIRHYAPHAQVVLVSGEQALHQGLALAIAEGRRAGVLLPRGWHAQGATSVFEWGAWDNTAELAARLYAGLRALDEADVEVILAPLPVSGEMAAALCDRLEKAARSQ
jgi:L-threonylcarbamoyladenylate synthase